MSRPLLTAPLSLSPQVRVAENNASNLVLQLRRLADNTTDLNKRSRLRTLAIEAEAIARQLGELA